MLCRRLPLQFWKSTEFLVRWVGSSFSNQKDIRVKRQHCDDKSNEFSRKFRDDEIDQNILNNEEIDKKHNDAEIMGKFVGDKMDTKSLDDAGRTDHAHNSEKADKFCTDNINKNLLSGNEINQQSSSDLDEYAGRFKRDALEVKSDDYFPVKREDESTSIFHIFTSEENFNRVEYLRLVQTEIDLRPSAIKRWYHNLQQRKDVKDQMYKEERVNVLGYDLAAAHFLVFRGGKIRFKNSCDWIGNAEEDYDDLPRLRQNDMHIEALDASRMVILYEGLECLSNLEYLTSASFANCLLIDDWCIDRICCQFADTLLHLDLSGCSGISEHGLTAIARLRNLQHLRLFDMDHIKNLKLVCLLLEESLPRLQIHGVNFF